MGRAPHGIATATTTSILATHCVSKTSSGLRVPSAGTTPAGPAPAPADATEAAAAAAAAAALLLREARDLSAARVRAPFW